MFYLWITWA